MAQRFDMTVNRLPARTWNWLQVNESRLSGINAEGGAPLSIWAPPEVRHIKGNPCMSEIETGMGRDMDLLTAEAPLDRIEIPAGTAPASPILLALEYGGGERRANRLEICAGEGSRASVVLELSASPDGEGLAAVQTRIRAARGAELSLFLVQRLGGGFTWLEDTGGRCEEGGTIRVVRLELGGKEIYTGCRAELSGDGARMDAQLGYVGRGEQRIDVNDAAVHKGKKSESSIRSSGVLRDRAFKLFRSTIDFQRGAAGSAGEEREDVLLLSSGAVNKTVPLILCGEEDVQGSHGATIGRLDEGMLFYLASRGIPSETACELLARARVDELCRQLPDEGAKERVYTYLKEVVFRG